MYEENSLKHWGIKGMRWGVRRFQNKDGTRTAAGKKRYDGEAETPEEREARKQQALKSGTAADVLKFRGELTTQELRAVKDRLDLEKQIRSLRRDEIMAGKQKVDDVISMVQTGVDAANTGINAWNVVAKITNTFSSKHMAVIGESKSSDTSGLINELRKSMATNNSDNKTGQSDNPKKTADKSSKKNDAKKSTKDGDDFMKKLSSYSDKDIEGIKKRLKTESEIKSVLFGNDKKSDKSVNVDDVIADLQSQIDEIKNKDE